MNELDCPEVKSMVTDLPSAVSAGQLAMGCQQQAQTGPEPKTLTTCERIAIGVALSRSRSSCPCSHDGGNECLRPHCGKQ